MFKKQTGAVLITCLVILISLTLLVLSGGQSGIVQEKMTAAMRDAHVSLEVAESGVIDAEAIVEALTGIGGFTDTGAGGRYSEGNGPNDLFADTVWSNALTSESTTTVSGQLSRYYIEYLGMLSIEEDLSGVNVTGYGETTGAGNIHGFKIVSRSTGRDGNTERIVVSYYGKRF